MLFAKGPFQAAAGKNDNSSRPSLAERFRGVAEWLIKNNLIALKPALQVSHEEMEALRRKAAEIESEKPLVLRGHDFYNRAMHILQYGKNS